VGNVRIIPGPEDKSGTHPASQRSDGHASRENKQRLGAGRTRADRGAREAVSRKAFIISKEDIGLVRSQQSMECAINHNI
jgi:hypothetical protein